MNKDIENKNIKTLTKAGFTLVETLVAVGILTLSIVATFTAVQNGIRYSTDAKDQITAFYLAQEGVEYIKNIRDENALHSINGSTQNWLAGLSDTSSDPCYFGKTCTIDSPNKVALTCPVGAGFPCPYLKQDSVTGLFGYTSSWTNTNFKRQVQFQNISDGREVEVDILIAWTTRGTTKSFQITESLFNRQ